MSSLNMSSQTGIMTKGLNGMDDFMRMMLFSGSLNRITEKDAFSPKKTLGFVTSYAQDAHEELSFLDDESDDDDAWDDF